MNQEFQNTILNATGASALFEIEVIQSLWSGYGKIVRIGLDNGAYDSVVVKHVRLPKQSKHPRGWNTDLSHERKVKSYEVEMAFYKQYSAYCNDKCKVPKCLGFDRQEDEVLIVLEDLDAVGYPRRMTSVNMVQIKACLEWLANFHATYLNVKSDDLWEVGTYWHLDTRPDELKVMDDKALRKAAPVIDNILRNSPFQTLVHGDAKLANFCFSDDGEKVAAVDFQYVGGGCGMKDVAYFVGSCLYEEDCEQMETELLAIYFDALEKAINDQNKAIDFSALKENWTNMYPLAWTDFHRFLKGWSPDHWKINSYSERLAREVVERIKMKQ